MSRHQEEKHQHTSFYTPLADRVIITLLLLVCRHGGLLPGLFGMTYSTHYNLVVHAYILEVGQYGSQQALLGQLLVKYGARLMIEV